MRSLVSALTCFTHLQIEGYGRRPRAGSAHLACGGAVTVSMHVMGAGAGYQYLLRSVAAGDGSRSLSTPLTRYYAEVGTPPGRWLGSGLPALGQGQVSVGDQVTEGQLGLLIGAGRDPVTGEQLGRAYPVFKTAREDASSTRRPVAAYDFTFSVPKSVSVLWGVADANLQEMIVETHHAAVADVLDFLEREVAATRAGVSAGDGAVAQVAVKGVVAAAFDHWDSRAGDPQLHTHVVISNKVQAAIEGRWRSLDGRPMHAAVTALSAYYDAVLADRLTSVFGFGWEPHRRGSNMHPHPEVAGVPDSLVEEFSSRSRDIDIETGRLVEEYVVAHGRHPSDATRIKLRAQATLMTRPEKKIRSLADLTNEWRTRATVRLGHDATTWARTVAFNPSSAQVTAVGIPADVIADLGARVVVEVGQRRTTWRHWNLWAEASRQTMEWRFTTSVDREAVVARVVAAAEQMSVALTPPEPATSPLEFQREDGTSVFRPRHATVYSSTELLEAEDRLLARADDITAPVVARRHVSAATHNARGRRRLSEEQRRAVGEIASSGRRVDVLVGPAGAGKTTTMRALRSAWERPYGRDSVVGLAPSAAAAEVLTADVGIDCENTAKWLYEHDRATPGYAFTRDQLVIIDEAGMADTRTLDRLTGIAAEAGAKVLLVGDPAQLDAVDAGGALALLAAARPDVPTLTNIHRFTHEWEKRASLRLREGRSDVIDTYARYNRLHDGTTEEMLDAAYGAWRRDLDTGTVSILVTESAATVLALNTRARADRILTGQTKAGREAALADGVASAGDVIITRRNNRRLRTFTGAWVRNGDRWTVLKVTRNGGLMVGRSNGHPATLTLPPEYVAEHVDLGYAVTAHRAQGLTVDTAHVLVSSRTTRENLYVSMTRGREANTAYVALDQPDESHSIPRTDVEINARTVLYGVLRHTGMELSAHRSIEAEHESWGSIAQLAAEYETLAAAAQHDRWASLIRGCGLTVAEADQVVTSDAFGPLTAALRQVEADGRDPYATMRTAVERRGLGDAEDIAAVLHHRLRIASKRPAVTRGRYVAGLMPAVTGPMPIGHSRALTERAALIEARARSLAEISIRSGDPWIRRLGTVPTDPVLRARWMDSVVTVASYRDRYRVDTDDPIGSRAESAAQRSDSERAIEAMRSARVVATTPIRSAAGGVAPSVPGR